MWFFKKNVKDARPYIKLQVHFGDKHPVTELKIPFGMPFSIFHSILNSGYIFNEISN